MGIGYLRSFDINSEVETLSYFNNESSADEVSEEKECVECDKSFTITQGEVNYFIQHGLVTPKRCKPCRVARKATKAVTPTRTTETHNISPFPVERVSITCDHCGRDAEVPFKPFPDSSVYCKVCWVGIKNIGAPINYN